MVTPAVRKGRTAQTKTGCITCRIRRVKCDESKPHCRKCVATGRTCDGYSTLPFSGRDLAAASRTSQDTCTTTTNSSTYEARLIPRLLSNSTFRGVTETRYFQLFKSCTVVSTNMSVNSRFWDRLVLQACEAEPAIKHAVLTLAALHSSVIEQSSSDVAQQHLAYSEKQYQLALCETKTLLTNTSSHQIDRVLITCALFVLYEGMRGNYVASQTHLNAGRAIVAQSRLAESGMSRRRAAVEIVETFARLDVFAITFSDGAAPYHSTLGDLLQTVPCPLAIPFTSVDQARTFLVHLLRWLLLLSNYIHFESVRGNLSSAHFDALWMDCGRQLSRWRQHWDELLDAGQGHSLHTEMIELWYTTAVTVLNSGLTTAETRYDSLYHDFARIVELSERLIPEYCKLRTLATFSLDLGFLMPNFLAAIRCRDAQLRRRAIHILERCTRREGIWESTAAAAIANRWVQIEEEGLSHAQRAEGIPEWKRIATVEPRIDINHMSAGLRFTFSADANQKKTWRDETIEWSPKK